MRTVRLVGPIIVATLLAAPRSAAADPDATLQVAVPSPSPSPSLSRPSETTKRWYGWQILIGYGVSDALIGGGVGLLASGVEGGVAPLVLGSIAHATMGPLTHLAHRRSAPVVAASAILEFLTPMIGLAVAVRLAPSCEPDRKPECYARAGRAIGAGAAVGGFAAGVVEVAAFSYEDAPPKRTSTTIALVPRINPRDLALTLAGTF